MLVLGGTRCPAHQVDPGTFGDSRRGSRQSRGYGAAWDKLRVGILARDGGVCRCDDCAASGVLLPAHEVDHVVSKAEWRRLHSGSLEGVDAPANLRAINRDCHRRKTQAEAAAARRGRGV